MANVHGKPTKARIDPPLVQVLVISISGQDPEWFLCIDVENKIELFKPFRMLEVVVWGQVEISDNLRRLRRYFREGQSIG